MKMNRFFLLLFLACIISACQLPEIRPSLWPLYRKEVHPKTGATETDILWPLFTLRSAGEKTGVHITPFFAHYENGKEDSKETFLFYPFGYRREKEKEVQLRFFPLLYYSKRYPRGRKDIDLYLFPLLFMGKDERENGKEESYFALFPLGGTIHDFLNKDEISFILFPLFYSSRKMDYHSVNFLWPLFSYGWGEKGDKRALTIFPFYSFNEKAGHHRRTTVLWPLLSWQENYLHTKNPSRLFQVFPLYGREKSEKGSKWFFLWPFFAGSSEPEEGTFSYDLPWPFFKWVKEPGLERFRILPFYSHKAEVTSGKKELDSTSYLWPLIWKRTEETKEYKKDSFYLLPFFHSVTKKGKQGEREKYWQLWPILHRSGGPGVKGTTGLPSPLLGRTLLGGAFSRIDDLYWPYWNLYRSTTRADGDQSTWILFKSISHHRGEDWERFDLPFLYGYSRDGSTVEHSFLLGLVRYRIEEKRKGVRLFYLFDLFF